MEKRNNIFLVLAIVSLSLVISSAGKKTIIINTLDSEVANLINQVIGSGVVACDSVTADGGVDLTIAGLDVTYPDMTIRLIDTDNNVTYCSITGATVAVPDDAHTVYYVDETCTVKNTGFATYVDTDLGPGGQTDLFNIYATDGVIEASKGITVKNKETIKVRKLLWLSTHLKVISGMSLNTTAPFPEVYQFTGKYQYIRTVANASAQNSTTDGLHFVGKESSSWTHYDQTGLNLSYCNNGTDTIKCSTDKYRRYLIYTVGFHYNGEDNTKIHELAPLDSETYTTLANCKDKTKFPPSFTLPADEEYVAVPTFFYCGSRDDVAWETDAWMDLRSDVRVVE